MKQNIKRNGQEADDMGKTIESRLSAARLSLNQALLTGAGDTAKLRQAVRDIEAEAQAAVAAEAAQEAATRAAEASKQAEHEASIRAASQVLLEARNARLDIVRKHFTTTRTFPDTRPSFA